MHLDYVDEDDLWQLLRRVRRLRQPALSDDGRDVGIAVRALSRRAVRSSSATSAGSRELPDEVAVKVPVGADEVNTSPRSWSCSLRDPAERERMGEAAAEYARSEHELRPLADLYLAALEEAAGGHSRRGGRGGEFARAADEVGIDADTPRSSTT